MQDPFRSGTLSAWAIVVVLVALVLWFARPARAQDAHGARQLTMAACRNLAELVVEAAEARDTGAKHQPYVVLLARKFDKAGVGEPARRIIFREIKRVFASPLSPEQHDLEVYTRCMTGPMGGADA